MEIPTPDERHDRLERFCGSWLGKVTVLPNPQMPDGMSAESRAETTRILDGWFVLMNYEQKQPRRSHLHGAWNDWLRRRAWPIHPFIGSTPWAGIPGTPAWGEWDGDRIVFTQVTSMGHSRLIFDFSGDDGYEFSMDASEDGQQWSRLMDESFKPAAE